MQYSPSNPYATAATTPRKFGSNGRTSSDANAITQANLWEWHQQQAGGGAKDRAEQNWDKALSNTEGRGDAVMNDPYTQAALDRFKGVLGGDVPYTAAVQTQQLSRQADAGATALGAQREMLAEQMGALGGSLADPSAQAALRRLMGANQAQNNANLGDMQTKATLTNFGARNDAASQLAGIRGGQLGMANGQYNQAAQMYANQQISGQHANAAPMGYQQSPGLNYNPGGNQGMTPAPAPVRPTPKPVLAGGTGPAPYRVSTPSQKPYGQVGAYTNRPSTTPVTPAYKNGVNTATNVPYGTGYVQMAGQPGTRVNMNSGLYNPHRPVY